MFKQTAIDAEHQGAQNNTTWSADTHTQTTDMHTVTTDACET